MAKAYQYTADGFYVGEIEDYGILPNNATYVRPLHKDGFIPRWNGETWELTENHIGEKYWPAGATYESKPEVMLTYGPLPQGATATRPKKPELTIEAVRAMKIAEIDSALEANDRKLIRPMANNEPDRIAAINAAQELNRERRAQVLAAQTVDEIRNIEPAFPVYA